MKTLSVALVAVLVRHALAQTTCAVDGSDYTYSEAVNGGDRTLSTSHCPNHPYLNINPNRPILENLQYTIPAEPRFVGNPTDSSAGSAHIDLSQQGGGVGLLFNGAFLFSPYGGPMYGRTVDWESSAPYVEGNSFDQCGCHASQQNVASYHCHQPPVCLMSQLGQTDGAHSPQLGWAFDGFPIYGPRGTGGVMMRTCSSSGQTYGQDVCTDDCGGYYNADLAIDEYVYRYYFQGQYGDGLSCEGPACPGPTSEYHPTSPMCFRGCCPSGRSCHGSITACPLSTIPGFIGQDSPVPAFVDGYDLSIALPVNDQACYEGVCVTTCTEQGWNPNNQVCGGGGGPAPSPPGRRRRPVVPAEDFAGRPTALWAFAAALLSAMMASFW